MDSSAGPARAVLCRRLLTIVAAIAGCAAYAGILPGDSILLGLMTSDPLTDLLHVAVAVALTVALLGHDARRLQMVATWCGRALVAAGVVTFLSPHLLGALPHGATPLDSVVLAGSGCCCLVAAGLLRPGRPTPTRTAVVRVHRTH
jgi:hypothetical protein